MKHSGGGLYVLSLVLFLSGCGQAPQLGSSQGSPAEVRPGGPSCEERSLDAPPDAGISWANYLRHSDRVYSATFEGQPDEAVVPAARLGTVTCTRSNSLTPVDHVIRDGEAAYAEVGTPFHAVEGRSSRDVITAVFDGKQLVFAFDERLTATVGEAAIWEIDPEQPPNRSERTVLALVSRMECASGITGEVLAPVVSESPDRVVVTFAVARTPDGDADCPGNNLVPQTVRLADPLGERVLYDGTCRPVHPDDPSACEPRQVWPSQ